MLDELIDKFLHEEAERSVSPLLGFGIFILPIIFVWFLLRDGHTLRSRVIGFGWFAFLVFAFF